MPECGQEGGFDVVGRDEVATGEPSETFGTHQQHEAGSQETDGKTPPEARPADPHAVSKADATADALAADALAAELLGETDMNQMRTQKVANG